MKSAREILQRGRRVALPVAIVAAAAGLLVAVNGHEPVRHWLVWPYLGFALATVGWLLSCVSVGHAALHALAIRLPFRERLLFDVTVGVLLFAIGIFIAGLLRLLHPPFFFVYPAVLLAIGARWTIRDLRRAWRHLRAARRRSHVPRSLVHLAAFLFGTLSLAIVYLTILVPENVAFDARTYHLPIAEHYAAWGRIGKFPEGWYAGVLPHLASWLYTWPFTARSANLFSQVELAAHMELALFVVTVFSTPLLVEALCPGRRVRGSWAVFFLFPGLFLYDSSLGVAADHVLAFWAIPLALALRRMAQPSRQTGALVGLMMAGAAMTKYQAVYLLVPSGLFVLFIVGRELRRARGAPARAGAPQRWRAILAPPAALGLMALVASAPHWLANVVWHGNPVFPLLRHLFPSSHPMVPGWPGPWLDPGFQPTGTLFMKLRETIAATFTFSFAVHDFAMFHRDVPVFGFLFTLTWPVLLLVRGGRRALVLAAGTLIAVSIWYWTFNEDRYLQAILPWMVATTAAALVLAWHAGTAARIGIVFLVAVQVAWGGDVPWLPTHAVMHEVPALRALQRFSTTYRGEFSARWQYDTGFDGVDRMLPKRAVVLLHEEYMKLGLNRRSIADSLRWQGAIDYRQLARPDAVHDLLQSYGATHLVWNRDHSPVREVPVAGELVFFGYALRYGEDRREAGDYSVARLPAKRPPANPPGPVIYVACNGAHAVGLDDLDRVVAERAGSRPPGGNLHAMLAAAEFAVVDTRCQGDVSALGSSFIEAPRWGDLRLWVRRN